MKRLPRKLKKKIPKGIYCYEFVRYNPNTYIYETKSCFFYKHISGVEGECQLLKCELIDQCKDCSINKKY